MNKNSYHIVKNEALYSSHGKKNQLNSHKKVKYND